MRGRRIALTAISIAQFLVVLDITAVTVAVPSIQTDLDLSDGRRHWVLTAYAVVFGGSLLFGGRLGDLRGHRRIFLWGVALFGGSSLMCAAAWSGDALVAARAMQGLGAALISPTATAVLARTFEEGEARNAALAVWGSVGALAAASGVFLGGLIVEVLDWRWIFLVNVPAAAVALTAGRRVLPPDEPVRRTGFDPFGAMLVTGGLALLVAGLSRAEEAGWSARSTSACLLTATLLLAAFAARETRVADPLVPRVARRSRAMVVANVAGFIHGAMMLAAFLLLATYMQRVLGLTAIEAGAGLLAVRGTSVAWAGAGARIAGAIGVRPLIAMGMVGMTGGLVSFAVAPPDGSYLPNLLPGLLLLGCAIPCLFLAISAAALEGVARDDAGVVSGLLNTSQWMGGALGLAAVGAISAGRTERLAASGADPVTALAGGIQLGFWACAALGALGTLVALTPVLAPRLPRRREARAGARTTLIPAWPDPGPRGAPEPAEGHPSRSPR
jgi:EmrB/QacA subfamily drug resistance transporter